MTTLKMTSLLLNFPFVPLDNEVCVKGVSACLLAQPSPPPHHQRHLLLIASAEVTIIAVKFLFFPRLSFPPLFSEGSKMEAKCFLQF